MRLNADIIYQNLRNELDVSFNGDNVRDLVLLRPEFYLDDRNEFLSNHTYVCSADHLPENPAVEDNVLLICLGSKTPPAYFFRGCSMITVPESEDIFRVFNLVQDVFNKYEAWEGRLNEILRGSASLQEMLDLSRDIFGNPLMLIGSDFNYLAYTDREYLHEHLGMNFNGPAFDPDLMAEYLTMYDIATNIREPLHVNSMGRSSLSVNIFDSDEYLGCITVFGEFRELTSSDTELASYFAGLLKQAFQRSPHLAGEHFAIRSAMKDIVQGQPVSSEQRSLISRRNNRGCLFCICLHPADISHPLPGGYVSSLIEQMIPGALSFDLKGPSEDAGKIAALIPVPSNGPDSRMAISGMLLPITEKTRMQCGISHAFTDLYDSAYAFFQAGAALTIGLRTDRNGMIHFYEDHILQNLLTRALGNVPVRFFYTDGLTRLCRHDASSQVSYVDTLKTYLDSNMSISRTALELNIHRSSLIDRLERINAILECDLNDPEARLVLQIVLHGMSQKEPSPLTHF